MNYKETSRMSKPFPFRCHAILLTDIIGNLGQNNDLLFRCPADMKFFQTKTQGKTIIMGRKTYESLPSKGLANRKIIVFSRQNLRAQDTIFVRHFQTLEEIADHIESTGTPEVWVCGGAEIYDLFINKTDWVDKIYWNKIKDVEKDNRPFYAYEADTKLFRVRDTEFLERYKDKHFTDGGIQNVTILQKDQKINVTAQLDMFVKVKTFWNGVED